MERFARFKFSRSRGGRSTNYEKRNDRSPSSRKKRRKKRVGPEDLKELKVKSFGLRRANDILSNDTKVESKHCSWKWKRDSQKTASNESLLAVFLERGEKRRKKRKRKNRNKRYTRNVQGPQVSSCDYASCFFLFHDFPWKIRRMPRERLVLLSAVRRGKGEGVGGEDDNVRLDFNNTCGFVIAVQTHCWWSIKI